ncbi:MAG: DUF3823 domain-containing protein [Bacteroidota bacterium]
MKAINLYIIAILGLLVSACELDNYDAPDASFFGSIIDMDTNEPIPQDLIQGSVIDYIELGFENPQIQQLRFKADGTFRNNLMFSGSYEVQPVRGNFLEVPVETIEISGDTEHTFMALPYIRINDVNMELNADSSKVIATFKLEQVASEPVKSLMLVADLNPSVGVGIRTVTQGQNVGTVVDPNDVFTIELRTNRLEKGKDYFFRVCALIDVPEAKYNFCTAIRLGI